LKNIGSAAIAAAKRVWLSPPPADLGHAARRSRDDLGEVVIENSALRWPPKTATDIGVFGVRMVPDF
jgi:hypothetical protein